MQPLRYGPGQIADALQIDDEFQAGKQFASLHFANLGNGMRDPVIDLALGAIQFFFAVLDRNERHVGRVFQIVPQVKRSIFRHQASLLD